MMFRVAAALLLLALISMVAMPFAASAQPTSAAPPPVDVVVLADGSQLSGTIIQQQPGQFVVIQTQDGTQHTLVWTQLQRVIVAPRPNPSSTPLVAAKRPI